MENFKPGLLLPLTMFIRFIANPYWYISYCATPAKNWNPTEHVEKSSISAVFTKTTTRYETIFSHIRKKKVTHEKGLYTENKARI